MSTYCFDRFELNCTQRRLYEAGRPVDLGARATDVLIALVEHRDRDVGAAELLGVVWPGVVVEENNLRQQVSALRKVLGIDAIATIPGRGYRFARPLRAAGEPGGAPAGAPAAAPPEERRAPRRYLVVDDHPLMAEALKLSLQALEPGSEVTTASDIATALALACGETQFDLCLLDLGLPDGSGLDNLTRLREACPSMAVVVVSGDSDPASITAALEHGAMGYIPKTSPRQVLIGAIRLIASGGVYVPLEALASRDHHAVAAPPGSDGEGSAPHAPGLELSPRQREVMALMLRGLPSKLIARRLDISENTTKIHVSAVLRALGVHSRTEALVAASRIGLRLEG